MTRDEERAAAQARQRLTGAGFRPEDAQVIVDHFVAADRHGKSAHGLARMDWLLRLPDLAPEAERGCAGWPPPDWLPS